MLALLFLVFCMIGLHTAPPNIVYILIDDLGWANVQYHNPRMQTPHLDNLLSESLVLNDFYVFMYCSPTRSSLLSGRLPYHVNQLNGPVCADNFGIPLNMTTISEKLVTEAGYVAHQIGKWHLGMSSLEYVPNGRGFKTSIGYLFGAEDHWTQIKQQTVNNISCSGVDLWNTTNPAYNQNGTYGGYIYGDRAVEIIDSHSANSKPLFLYLATQNCHGPLQVPQSYIDKFNATINDSAQRTYAGMMDFEDELIGNVTKALKRKNLWNNTLLFITADNGGIHSSGNNSPLRGGKFSNFQGGVRVVAMVSGGYLPQHRRGKVLNETIHICDIYSTICSVVDIDPTDHRAMTAGLPPIDSINMWPLIINEQQVSERNEFILSTGIQGTQNEGGGGIMSGDYKMLFGLQKPAFWTTLDFPNGTKGEPQEIHCGDVQNGGCLFNIKLDPTEHFDVINETENAALAQQLRNRFIELNNTAYVVNLTKANPNCCSQMELNGNFWGPWIGYNDTIND